MPHSCCAPSPRTWQLNVNKRAVGFVELQVGFHRLGFTSIDDFQSCLDGEPEGNAIPRQSSQDVDNQSGLLSGEDKMLKIKSSVDLSRNFFESLDVELVIQALCRRLPRFIDCDATQLLFNVRNVVCLCWGDWNGMRIYSQRGGWAQTSVCLSVYKDRLSRLAFVLFVIVSMFCRSLWRVRFSLSSKFPLKREAPVRSERLGRFLVP